MNTQENTRTIVHASIYTPVTGPGGPSHTLNMYHTVGVMCVCVGVMSTCGVCAGYAGHARGICRPKQEKT